MRLVHKLIYAFVFICFLGDGLYGAELPCLYTRPQLPEQTENLVVGLVDSPWCARLQSRCKECCNDFAIGLLQRFEDYAARSSPGRMERFQAQSDRILTHLATQDPSTLPPPDALTLFQWMEKSPGDYFDRVVQELGLRRHHDLYREARTSFSQATGFDDLNRRFFEFRTIGKDEPALHTVREYYAQRVLDFVAPDGSEKRKLFGKLQSRSPGSLYSDANENLDDYFDLYEEVAGQLGPKTRAPASQTWQAFKGKIEGLRNEFLEDFRRSRLHGLPAPVVFEPLQAFVQKPERTPMARFMFSRTWPLGRGNVYDHNKILMKLMSLQRNDSNLFNSVGDSLLHNYKRATAATSADAKERIFVGNLYNLVVADGLTRQFRGSRIFAEPEVLQGQGDFLIRNISQGGRDIVVEAKLSLRMDEAAETGRHLKRQLERAKDFILHRGTQGGSVDFQLAHPDGEADVPAWLSAHIRELNSEIIQEAQRQGMAPGSVGRIIPTPLTVR